MYVVLNLCTIFTNCLLIQTSSGVILPADLQTLESYSRRIKHIHLSTFKERVSSHIYSSITQHLFNNNSCLFPALRCFGCSLDSISEGNLVILPLITTSPLSTIGIRNVTGAIEIHLASFLHGIANSHPSSSTTYPLSSLFLDGMIKMSTLSQLEIFKKLSTLELKFQMDFPLAILSSLSRLPSLAALSLLVRGKQLTLDVESSARPAVYSFPNLRHLRLWANSNVVLRISQSIYGERLLRVTLGLGPYSTADALKACVKRCPEMAPQMFFYVISVNPIQGLHQDMFPPLPTNYAQLRSFSISSVAIPLEHFRDLFDYVQVGLWSALETLDLQVAWTTVSPRMNWPEIDQVVPLSSLSMVAASCPRLHTLRLYLHYPVGEGNRETEVLTNYIQNSQTTNHQLTHLKIEFLDPFVTVPQPGDIMDAVTISRFIDHVFPKVQDVDIFDRFGDRRKEWYSGIKAMMKNYRDVRANRS